MIFMKKKGFVAAAMAAVLASSMLSVPAFAWSKVDVISSDDHSVTIPLLFDWGGITSVTIADTEKGTHYNGNTGTGYLAVVMENENTAPDATTLTEVNPALSATSAKDFDFENIPHCWWEGITKVNFPADWNENTTYVISGSNLASDGEKLYRLPGVKSVYSIDCSYTSDAFFEIFDVLTMQVYVPKGTEFGVEQCADLPYTVTSATKQEDDSIATKLESDLYELKVTIPDGDPYKTAFAMLNALLKKENIAYTYIPYLITLESANQKGTPAFEEFPNHYLAANSDLDGDGTVGVSDAVELLTYYARKAANLPASFSRFDDQTATLKLADVNKDGNIDTADAVEILTYYARKAAGLL